MSTCSLTIPSYSVVILILLWAGHLMFEVACGVWPTRFADTLFRCSHWLDRNQLQWKQKRAEGVRERCEERVPFPR